MVKRMQECKIPRKKVLERMTSPGAAFLESSVEGEALVRWRNSYACRQGKLHFVSHALLVKGASMIKML